MYGGGGGGGAGLHGRVWDESAAEGSAGLGGAEDEGDGEAGGGFEEVDSESHCEVSVWVREGGELSRVRAFWAAKGDEEQQG